jgi:Ca-activated chloride channel family protein
MAFDDKTQMTPGYDPNRTQIGGIDPNRTQIGGMDPGATAMPGSMRAVDVECIPGNTYALATQSSREHVLLKIIGSGTAMGPRMPLNLCLILDRSGSMEGAPLDYVKQACGFVIDLLEPTDVLSIVAFTDQAELIKPAGYVANKQLVKEHINRLEVGNTTDLFGGIAMGCGQVASVASPSYVNRALLLTDGEPTAGTKDFASIVGQVAEQKSRGITVTALGFGPEYNEELLASVAKKSGGNYYYIMRPELIPEVFRKELQTMMSTVARNLRLRVRMSRWVQVRQIHGKQPTCGHRTAEVTLADIERGEVQTALVEIEVGARPGGKYRVAQVELSYDDSLTARTETTSADVVIDFTTDASLIAGGISPIVQRELEVAEASKNLERTVMGMRTQQISPAEAIQEMERTRMILVQQGKTMQAEDMQRAIDQIKQGGAAEKTLIGINLDREKQA